LRSTLGDDVADDLINKVIHITCGSELARDEAVSVDIIVV